MKISKRSKREKTKKIAILIIVVIIVVVIIVAACILYRFHQSREQEMTEDGWINVELCYIGSAHGRLNIVAVGVPEEWAKKEYVYNQYNGYFIITEKSWDFCAKACEFSDLDFEPQFEENHAYVCTYGYQLKTLEYSTEKRTSWSNGYYNRATLWTDDFHEKTYYFYEIGEIGHELGNMLEDNEEYAHEFTRSGDNDLHDAK